MLCIGCGSKLERPLCSDCRTALRPGPEFLLDGQVLIAAGLHHHSVARRLVHRLKYGGLLVAGEILADAMVPRLRHDAAALVPVPRAVSRRIRFGIDPADALAVLLRARTGVPVIRALRPALWWPRHATQTQGKRRPARFFPVRAIPPNAVLVDDVVTSGATIRAACTVFASTGHPPIRAALSATSPGTIDLRSPQAAMVRKGPFPTHRESVE